MVCNASKTEKTRMQGVVVSQKLVILVNISNFTVTLGVKFVNIKWVEFCTKSKIS